VYRVGQLVDVEAQEAQRERDLCKEYAVYQQMLMG
jgi:hypothetical protein